MLGIWKQVNN